MAITRFGKNITEGGNFCYGFIFMLKRAVGWQ